MTSDNAKRLMDHQDRDGPHEGASLPMTDTLSTAGLLSMDASERGQRLERLIQGRLGMNQVQAEEALAKHFGRFARQTLSKMYAGDPRVRASTWIKVEQWAEDQLRLRVEAGPVGDDVEVTGRTEKHIAFKFKGVKGYGIEDVEVVVPIEYADLGREAVRDLMREVMRGQHPEKSDPEDPET